MGNLETELKMTQDKAKRKSIELADTQRQNETLVHRHRAELANLQDEKDILLFNSTEEIDKISGLLDTTMAKLDNATSVISDLEAKTAHLSQTISGMENEKTQLSKTINEKVLKRLLLAEVCRDIFHHVQVSINLHLLNKRK